MECRNASNLASFIHWPRRVANNGSAIWHISCYNSTHANHSTFANSDRGLIGALPNHCIGPYVCIVADVHAPVAANTGRKSNEIANHAVMRNIRVDIRLKIPTNLRVGGDHGVGAKNRTLANMVCIQEDCLWRVYGNGFRAIAYGVHKCLSYTAVTHCYVEIAPPWKT